MIYKLNKLIIIIILFFMFSGFNGNNPDLQKNNIKDNKTEKFFDIFSPDNLKGVNKNDDNKKNNLSKINEFTLYGIINTDKIKEVLIKPKRLTKEVRDLRNRRGYIILHLNDKIYKYQLVKIEDNIAFFKKGEEILKLSVFNEEKKDRPNASAKSSGPKVIAQPPLIATNGNTSKKNKKLPNKNNSNNPVVILNKNKNKKTSAKSKVTKKNNSQKAQKKKVINPFLELIERAKKQNKNSAAPTENPFLKLFQQR